MGSIGSMCNLAFCKRTLVLALRIGGWREKDLRMRPALVARSKALAIPRSKVGDRRRRVDIVALNLLFYSHWSKDFKARILPIIQYNNEKILIY